MEILRGRGLQIHVEVSFSGFEMWSNESHCTFPINSGNQTNTNTPSVEINKGSFFVIYFLFLFPALNDTDALLSIMFVTRQVEQNAKEEVQQCKNSKVNLWMIFYTLKIVLYNCLDAAHAFSSTIHAVKWDPYSVYFMWYLHKIISSLDLL